uniref:IQ motif containing K n=1 Tax=Eptatretus burgeri TaxID=7764 RepID=A0A8C4Q3Q3_EPTBU
MTLYCGLAWRLCAWEHTTGETCSESSSTSSFPVDRQACSSRAFLEYFVFPTLMPGLEELLRAAKKKRCFERSRTEFNGCDFLTEWLYNKNPQKPKRGEIPFMDIPFVNDFLLANPRPPLPLFLLLSDDEAATIIQAFYRGYLTRRNLKMHELQQNEVHEENLDEQYEMQPAED